LLAWEFRRVVARPGSSTSQGRRRLVVLKGKGLFSKTTAYLGLGTGIFGILSAAGFFVTIFMNAVLATVWLLFVGYRFCRLSQQ